MRNKNFTPEEDFEKENLSIINNLRKINDEELSEEFEEKLHKGISLVNFKSRQKFIFWQSIKNVMVKMSHLPQPVKSIGYTVLTVFVLLMVYISIQTPGNISNRNTHSPGKKNEKIEADITREKSSIGDIKNSLSEKGAIDRLYYELSDSNEIVIKPSIAEIKKILTSEVFREKIAEYKSPVLDDSLKIIAEIFRNPK